MIIKFKSYKKIRKYFNRIIKKMDLHNFKSFRQIRIQTQKAYTHIQLALSSHYLFHLITFFLFNCPFLSAVPGGLPDVTSHTRLMSLWLGGFKNGTVLIGLERGGGGASRLAPPLSLTDPPTPRGPRGPKSSVGCKCPMSSRHFLYEKKMN